jgi:excinuclease ABC subunit C
MDLQKVNSLPQSPGVYIFKDKSGKILYIGKAANLRKRVGSYFSRLLCDKTQSLVSQISDIEYILTPSEAQALVKEAALVKKYLPRYNVALRDDKSFPLIRITGEEYPQVYIFRKKKQLCDDARYFGPYTNAKLLRSALKIMRQVFGFRSCKILPKKTCLYYRLNLCPGPCIGKISKAGYNEIIDNIVLFLEGRQDALLKKLCERMDKLSRARNYEEAAKVRDQIQALGAVKKDLSEEDYVGESEELMQKLKLPKLPQRIEAFDISNISGQDACGSMVYFYNGRPAKFNYRRFKIKEVRGIDDYAMLSEVIRRRYLRLKEENKGFPDLILIDGGRQHLLTAKREINKLMVEIPIISLAKEQEKIYTLDRKEPFSLPYDSGALHLVQRIRDEAHRFAVSYHYVLRRKRIVK